MEIIEKNGKKYRKVLKCDDSAGQSSSPSGVRFITENFFNQRNTGALYFLGAKDVSVPQDNSAQKIAILTKLRDLYAQLIKILSK